MKANDGRKNNGGHSTKGRAGRKPVAHEVKVQDVIKRAFDYDPLDYDEEVEIWRKVIEKAKKGYDKHIQLLFNYRYGKPKETVDLVGGMKFELTTKIVRE